MRRLLLLLLLASPAMAQRIVLISGGTVTANVTDSADFYVTLNQNVTGVTLTSTVTPATGYLVSMKFVQDATGSRTVVFGGNISTACVVNSTANSVTICRWQYTASTNAWADAGGGVSPNSPIPQAQVGPGFNVVNYGVVNDAQSSSTCTINTSTTQVCSQASFCNAGSVPCAAGQASNVGMEFSCGFIFTGAYGAYVPKTTIVSVTNATTVVTAAPSIATQGNTSCSWGTASATNDAKLAVAITAWLAAVHGKNSLGIVGAPPGPARLYFPAGGYLLCTTAIAVPTNKDGFVIEGDAMDSTQLIWEPGCTISGSDPINIAGSASNGWVRNFTMNGMGGNQVSSNASALVSNGSNIYVDNVNVQGFNLNGVNVGGGFYSRGLYSKNNNGKGFICNQCSGDVDAAIFSNNGQNNLVIQNVSGLPTGAGFRVGRGMLVDETGSASFPPTLVTNSHDVIFDMPQLFSTPGAYALDCDANSHIAFIGGQAAVFGADSNSGGIHIRQGCVVDATGVRFSSTGTAKAIQVDAGGQFRDNGGNSSESMFPIVSGTSTGTTVVLTLTPITANVNTNCTVGDAFVVQGAGIAGYNTYSLAGATTGITAVTATTVTYTSVGSNMGALGAGGVFSCRNLQSYGGTLPIALLNNPIPNTCHLTITPIVNATNYLLCNFRAQSATNITRIMASSQNVTTCATAPIITISDGTATVTLTLTSAKQQWDSSVDASTGVGTTIFKPNGTITVRYDVAAASACATPPTQLAISYNISPILSN